MKSSLHATEVTKAALRFLNGQQAAGSTPVQLVDSILQPERLRACEESLKADSIRRMWPKEVAEKTFIDYLWSQYDYTQLGAIEVQPLHRPWPL